jgi:TRAP-type C4-dicarboxylate transport system permease small subunit
MDGGPAWLAALPTGPNLLLVGAVAALTAALVRRSLGRTAFGVRALRVLHVGEAGFLAALLAAMLVFSFLQILLRNVAHTGWVWVDPLLRHLLLWIGFVGGMLATRVDQHINVDAVTRAFSPLVRRRVHALTSVAAAATCLFLAGACLAFMRDEAAAGTTSFLEVPTWRLLLVMPVALWIMCARFVRHALDAITGTPPPEPAALAPVPPPPGAALPAAPGALREAAP